ncbi:unknown [Collinsella sp. CAG:398]|nr:unknown [Collinsella sp. CAG:398]
MRNTFGRCCFCGGPTVIQRRNLPNKHACCGLGGLVGIVRAEHACCGLGGLIGGLIAQEHRRAFGFLSILGSLVFGKHARGPFAILNLSQSLVGKHARGALGIVFASSVFGKHARGPFAILCLFLRTQHARRPLAVLGALVRCREHPRRLLGIVPLGQDLGRKLRLLVARCPAVRERVLPARRGNSLARDGRWAVVAALLAGRHHGRWRILARTGAGHIGRAVIARRPPGTRSTAATALAPLAKHARARRLLGGTCRLRHALALQEPNRIHHIALYEHDAGDHCQGGADDKQGNCYAQQHVFHRRPS